MLQQHIRYTIDVTSLTHIVVYRCGALHPGDQLLAFDDHVIEGNNYTAEEVMCYLENSEPGFTRLHVAPRHVITHSGRYTRGKRDTIQIMNIKIKNPC